MEQITDDFPVAVSEQVKDFHIKLTNLISMLDPILKNYHQLKEIASKNVTTIASFELTICYLINSLYWMYLQTNGFDVKEHPIKTELERIKQYFNRLKEIKESNLKSKINKVAAGAFVRNALFDVKDKKTNNDEKLKENPYKKQKKK